MNRLLIIIMYQQDGDTALHWAAMNGHTDIVTILLEYNADVHIKDNVSQHRA